MADRDVTRLVGRMASALVRLLGERLDLARVELREETGAVLAIAVGAGVGALAAGIGLVMVALGAVELLAPWLPGRGTRLLLVGAPLAIVGVWRVHAAARALAARGNAVPRTTEALREDLAALTDPDDEALT